MTDTQAVILAAIGLALFGWMCVRAGHGFEITLKDESDYSGASSSMAGSARSDSSDTADRRVGLEPRKPILTFHPRIEPMNMKSSERRQMLARDGEL